MTSSACTGGAVGGQARTTKQLYGNSVGMFAVEGRRHAGMTFTADKVSFMYDLDAQRLRVA